MSFLSLEFKIKTLEKIELQNQAVLKKILKFEEEKKENLKSHNIEDNFFQAIRQINQKLEVKNLN